MVANKIKVAALVGSFIFSFPTFVSAKGASVSASRASFSPSRSSISSSVRSSRPVAQTTYTRTSRSSTVHPKPTITPSKTRARKSVEYDYYPYADCTRIVKPINGYRCIDRD